MATRILFRVDSDARVGLGHLRRCRSLAVALEAEGLENVFLCRRDSTRGFVDGLRAEMLNGIPSWGGEDLRATLALACRSRCQAVLVDSHEVDAVYLNALRKAGLFVIARDDLAAYPFPCQMVFNGNANARALAYASSSGDTRFLLGPEYAVLPPDFKARIPREVPEKVREILITLGGADAIGWMPRLLQRLDSLVGDFSVTAVAGPFFENQSQIHETIRRGRRVVRVLESPSSLYDFMVRADLCISSAGQTLYELACVGCPTVTFPVADNQRGQLRSLAAAGSVWACEAADPVQLLEQVEEGVVSLMEHPQLRRRMAESGQRLVDGAGAGRVAEVICQEVSSACGRSEPVYPVPQSNG